MEDVENLYLQLGGKFLKTTEEIQDKLKGIKAFVFDWDGVFNTGQKTSATGSTFSEVDSMGTNLLRYSYYLNNKKLPIVAVISGEKNETAAYLSKREHFHYSFFKITTKAHALNFICEKEKLKPSEVAFFFDDVLDLSIAELCGLRVLVNHKTNPLFTHYCIKNNMADYITSANGGNYAVREGAELLMALNGNYEKVVSDRKNSAPVYREFVQMKKTIITRNFTEIEDKIEEAEM